MDLSRDKANSVASQIDGQAIIISADSIVYMDGKIFEKPKSKEEAFQNIKANLFLTTHHLPFGKWSPPPTIRFRGVFHKLYIIYINYIDFSCICDHCNILPKLTSGHYVTV